MTLRELIERNRSYRRFDGNATISEATLRELVDLARLSPSGRNLQPLRYLLSWTPERNALIFPCLAWAGYLKEWPGPAEAERPTAYILVLGDTRLTRSFGVDPGIAAQSILLGAVERGLGGCMLSSVNHEAVRRALNISEVYEVLLAIALGKPVESVVIDSVGPEGDIKYWRDEAQTHHVPKRALNDLIVE